MVSSCRVKSNSISPAPPEDGISEVVSPRAVTYSVEFHQWFDRGSRPSRVLPTIWVHRCTVSRVGCHCSSGREGQLMEWFPSERRVPPSCVPLGRPARNNGRPDIDRLAAAATGLDGGVGWVPYR